MEEYEGKLGEFPIWQGFRDSIIGKVMSLERYKQNQLSKRDFLQERL